MQIDGNRALQQLQLYHLLAVSLLADFVNDGLCRVVAQRLEDHLLENLVPLVVQLGTGMHLAVKPVEVLEKALHPLDHDLVVLPSLVQLDKQFLALELLKVCLHILLEEDPNGVGVLGVKDLLRPVVLNHADIVHDSEFG
jgi:hypothetical protein